MRKDNEEFRNYFQIWLYAIIVLTLIFLGLNFSNDPYNIENIAKMPNIRKFTPAYPPPLFNFY
uniref:Uncharacterized protein n=1 Tax=viral metagenome TaxID=1070528 RepID=A0A6C0E915_9ZZZZ